MQSAVDPLRGISQITKLAVSISPQLDVLIAPELEMTEQEFFVPEVYRGVLHERCLAREQLLKKFVVDYLW